jgi:hypothetical protein
VLNIVLLPCMVLAGVGFVMSVAAHVLSLAGVQLPGGAAVFSLHVGIFIVGLPTILVMTRFRGRVANRDIWKVALLGCPTWMKRAVPVVLGYACLNFFLFLAGSAFHQKAVGASPPSVVRAFSGHWMLFYSAAFATLYSVRRRPELLVERKCSAEHPVSFNAEFCEVCGERLARWHSGA